MTFIKRVIRLLRIIVINLFLLILLFVSMEVAARSYAYFVNKGSFFRPDNFISPWITTYDYPPPRVMQDGKYYFRHRELPTRLEKPADTIRVIAVGGSTTANERPYLVNQVDYPKALETKLAENNQHFSFEVLNAGADAYSTAQSLINIQFRLVEFKPDIILLMHNINDSSVNAFQDGATPDYANKYLDPAFLNPSLQEKTTFLGLLAKSRLLAKIGFVQMIADKSLKVDNPYEYGLHLFKRNLAAIASICKMHHIDLVLLSQPYSMEPSQYIQEEVFLKYSEAINEIANDQDVVFIDMFSKYGHDKQYFIDQFHYTPAGIDRFADILSTELENVIHDRIQQHGK